MQAISSSFGLLLVLRLLLGISEAAFGPGVPFYLSFFYKRDELALRTGLFISAAPLATSFAASLAWVITKISQHIAITPWRMLFLVEGFPSIIIAVFAWFYIPDSPETAVYLNRRARRVARLRLRKEDFNESGSEKKGLDYTEILATLIDPKAYITAVSSPLLADLHGLSSIRWPGTALNTARDTENSNCDQTMIKFFHDYPSVKELVSSKIGNTVRDVVSSH